MWIGSVPHARMPRDTTLGQGVARHKASGHTPNPFLRHKASGHTPSPFHVVGVSSHCCSTQAETTRCSQL
jgi:hypothetical protein